MKFKKNYYSVFTAIFIISIFFTSCVKTDPALIKDGVTIDLANLRNKQLSNIEYNLVFQIPDSVTQDITGNGIIKFDFNTVRETPLILDFRNPETSVKSVKLNGKKVRYKFINEHIIISHKKLKNGRNRIEIDFIAGNRALNRNTDYLYTLFVPDRTCTAFPCFDQPSLKARFQTKLIVPHSWAAVANSPLIAKKDTIANQSVFLFDKTQVISTYLYSFVAGEFDSVTRKYDDREITMYHRENDTTKLLRNTDKLFDLHYSSVKWLEEYTQIDYPFNKFDFVIIPSFQYSGMEHPGAILYRDSRLLLEESSTIRQELNRANLIAHETAHMWFGDLVTMEWFSEVWLKEVFANFMAGKMVNPQYPEINHHLNFLINHYPAAYSVDRTRGANPIEQKLENMKNAGTLYGDIIYHKAPIVMQHLENITGEELLQKGLQEYLAKNRYGNANWDKLISILNSKLDFDLYSWSKNWVYEAGMPHYVTEKAYNTNNELQTIIIEQKDPEGQGQMWPQKTELLISGQKYTNTYTTELTDTFNAVELTKTGTKPSYVFPNSNGLSYGYFKLDSISAQNILNHLQDENNPVLRCAMYISLWENMLQHNIKPIKLFNAYNKSLNTETNPQNIDLVLGYSATLFWKFMNDFERISLSLKYESLLWNELQNTTNQNIKSSFFNTYKKIATTDSGVKNLFKIWNKEITFPELKLSTKDFSELAFELVLRNITNSDSVLAQQYNRIENREKKARFLFMQPAVSSNEENRAAFFESLKKEQNREKEPWVIDALYYFHHPLRSTESVKYIRPSLEILPELQITGDIFFPKRWLDATFSGHSSVDAVIAINLFLNKNPKLPDNLKNKIYQSTDLVFRASIIKGD